MVSGKKKITYEQMTEFYKSWWKIEEFHKLLKNKVSLAKRQIWAERTQRNHIFACVDAFIKLELIGMKVHFIILLCSKHLCQGS
ncbi:MAG: hypothetical protein HYV28_00450 [Ignavibacteriales bacterium]|nr:hypothetical protein [Ignavibacteriales bacterium]